ncbi:hypothetical protein HON22_00625 [Candidatus Peregrinibacteria bacterium]|jgi:hypothetical protein|nr:hypothetical protein [Candidatus Peregrinibacteria bacterium]
MSEKNKDMGNTLRGLALAAIATVSPSDAKADAVMKDASLNTAEKVSATMNNTSSGKETSDVAAYQVVSDHLNSVYNQLAPNGVSANSKISDSELIRLEYDSLVINKDGKPYVKMAFENGMEQAIYVADEDGEFQAMSLATLGDMTKVAQGLRDIFSVMKDTREADYQDASDYLNSVYYEVAPNGVSGNSKIYDSDLLKLEDNGTSLVFYKEGKRYIQVDFSESGMEQGISVANEEGFLVSRNMGTFENMSKGLQGARDLRHVMYRTAYGQ